GEYLAGYLAGLMGFKNVGTVATQPLPEVVRGVNAFTIGLLKGLAESRTAHDPAKVNTVVWLKSWRDAVNETTLAQTLAAMGHDLIRQMADTCDSSKAACRMGVPAMGYGADAAGYGADCVLVSTVFDWGSIYIDRVRAILDGTWKAEAVWNGFDKGGVSLSRFNASVPKEAAAMVLAQKDQLAKGRDDIFAGPLSDQSGKVRIAAGQKASDQDLLAMRWFVTGVSGRIPD
ncbi:MAG: BMP family ABC transporter substrate-binding protein, partial [Desulfovibrionaceae bacterium]|nr:BMP family ABC transporter substrate-binding protein [Desulfovibrionaceae bacterium]